MPNTSYAIHTTAPLVVVLGATASGKSELAMKLAKEFNGEIIAADSRTVYKGLDIGTAKPSKADQEVVRHHLIDVVEPDETFTAANFKKMALSAIDDIASRGKLPIMVGGSGLYIDSVIYDFDLMPPSGSDIRAKLDKLSTSELAKRVKALGIADIDFANRRRLIRALETGRVNRGNNKLRDNTLLVALSRTKEELRARIEARAEKMFDFGVVEEARKMFQKYGEDKEALSGIIYRQTAKYLNGEIDLVAAKSNFITKDWQLAKRQMTWFKRNGHILWVSNETGARQAVEKFLRSVKYNTTSGE